MSEDILYLNDTNFDEKSSEGVILIDFYADWCGPCRMLAPMLEELSKEMSGKATIGKVDIDAAQDTASKLGIHAVPTLILFKNGKEVDRVVGVRDKASLKSMIEGAL